MKITFLGTGASGGTPGIGRSKRFESPLFLQDEMSIVIDVTRNFSQQASDIKHIDSILLTHGHKDAIGGFYQLRKWKKQHTQKKIQVFAHPKTISTIQKNFRMLDHCTFLAFHNGQKATIGPWHIEALEVPHSQPKSFPTFAWKIRHNLETIVYASDIASITQAFTAFCQNADILIIDGAMWRKQIYTHLTIDRQLPAICTWKVGKIFLTQIGKTALPYEKLIKEVRTLCPKAYPAYDGMKITW